MSSKQDSAEVSKRLGQQIRQAEHGIDYYFALFLFFFAIPLYVLLQFFYADAGGWNLFDIIFVLILLVIAIYGLYGEFASKTKLSLWFTVLGVISGIIVTILRIIL